MSEQKVVIDQRAVSSLRRGNPLIRKTAIKNVSDLKDEGSLIKLYSETNEYLGTGYYGEQNKAVGWLLTTNEREEINATFFKEKILYAIKKRAHFYQDSGTTAFRVFNEDGDGIGGLTIDYYVGYYLIQWYSKGIYHFRDFVYESLKSAPQFLGIYEKKRFNQQGQYIEQDDFVLGQAANFPLLIKENGMNYAVNLNDGAMTGIFLDQRNVRKLLRDCYAENKVVLNTFSYTGAFSVAARYGGAQKTISVDLAKRSLPMTQEQFAVNDFSTDSEEIRVMDVFNYFRYAIRNALEFDVVILDPPSFARSKKMTFSTAKDYPELIHSAIQITKNDGVIIASTNNASFNMQRFKQLIDDGFKLSKKKYVILEEESLPDDFPYNKRRKEGNYLKVLFLKVKK